MSVITFSKDKRAISIMIGYILLITSAVVMSAIVYQWMKTYVPKDAIDCPEGVSLFISESSCIGEGDNYQLKLITKNNGRFDIGGYFIHATDSEDQKLATIDLSENLTSGGKTYNNAVIFSLMTDELGNYLKPNEDHPTIFDVSSKLLTIELIPIRFQVHDNKKRLVSCGGAKIVGNLYCGECFEDNDCEAGFKCEGGVCVEDLCGNEIVDFVEECDGSTGCLPNCVCDNGYVAMGGNCIS